MTFISRRDLLKRAVGAAAAAGSSGVVTQAFRDGAELGAERPGLQSALHREPLENLTAAESDILEAVAARLIPSDEHGPGATEARAAHYIDRALGGALAPSRQPYTAGLAALD